MAQLPNRRLHILYILPYWYGTPSRPLDGVFFREQARAARRRGHRVGIIVTPRLRTRREASGLLRLAKVRPELERQVESGIPTYRCSFWGIRRLLRRGVRGDLIVRMGRRLFEWYLREVGTPEVIHAHCLLYSGYLAATLGREAVIPTVVTEHSSKFRRGLIEREEVANLKQALRSVDRVLAVSPSLAEELERYAGDVAVLTLGNTVDAGFFSAPSERPASAPFVFASVGSFVSHKRFDLLLAAFSQAFRGEDVVLRLAGDGPLSEELAGLAQRLGIEEQVAFLGTQSRDGVRTLMWGCHAVVSSSDVETFGVTLIEAMACGKPVVATRSGGPESFVDESNGILVAPGDADALAEALVKMRDTHRDYDAQEIRKRCVGRFGEEEIMKRLETIYEELLQA